jgi:hypothetical protein
MYCGVPSSVLSWVRMLCEPRIFEIPKSRTLAISRIAVDLLGDQEDVLRLQIAVDDVLAVRRGHRGSHLADDGQHVLERHGAVLDALRERLALQVLEDEVRRAVGGDVEVGDVDDVGVVELRGDQRLAPEPRHDLVVGHLGVEQLDRDLLAGQPAVARDEDGAHAAAPDHRLDRVGIGDHRADIHDRTRR